MVNDPFTHTDYYDAAHLRCEDFKYLRNNPQSKSVVFAVYCAGVAVECMLRAYMAKNNVAFDAKHDIKKLYEKSQMAALLSNNEKEKISAAIITLHKNWDNNFRYSYGKRIKRLIGHQFAESKFKYKDINKYLNNYYSDVFNAAELIIQTGATKWNS
jgi:hypothetical protein